MIASEVILLLSGPTVMNASIVGSRTISAIWLVLMRNRHFFGIDARFRQDDAEQRDVHLSSTDDADATTSEIFEHFEKRRAPLFPSPRDSSVAIFKPPDADMLMSAYERSNGCRFVDIVLLGFVVPPRPPADRQQF
jgi:hypothetical protein